VPPSPSLLRAALVLSLAGAALGAGPAVATAADLKLSKGYVFYSPAPKDPDYAGYAVFVFRTTKALPTKEGEVTVKAVVGGSTDYLFAISRQLHCYGVSVPVRRDAGKRARGRVGDRVRVLLGAGGRIADHRFTVHAQRKGYFRGAPLGCGADPKSKVVQHTPSGFPYVEPYDIFFAANAAPYLHAIAWTGWGTERATGTATYISECASCGDPVRRAVTVIAEQLEPCPARDVSVYASYRMEWVEDGVTRTEKVPGGDGSSYPCRGA
jgi:hypothetical protein